MTPNLTHRVVAGPVASGVDSTEPAARLNITGGTGAAAGDTADSSNGDLEAVTAQILGLEPPQRQRLLQTLHRLEATLTAPERHTPEPSEPDTVRPDSGITYRWGEWVERRA